MDPMVDKKKYPTALEMRQITSQIKTAIRKEIDEIVNTLMDDCFERIHIASNNGEFKTIFKVNTYYNRISTDEVVQGLMIKLMDLEYSVQLYQNSKDSIVIQWD